MTKLGLKVSGATGSAKLKVKTVDSQAFLQGFFPLGPFLAEKNEFG